jgi:hypothetical protein
MTNEDLVGGLKSALARGESLEKAMMSFYNAGYLKEDIEWAAKSLQMRGEDSSNRYSSSKDIPLENKNKQRVSKYDKKLSIPGGKIGIILIGILLFFILAVIVSLLFFGDKVIDFFNHFF